MLSTLSPSVVTMVMDTPELTVVLRKPLQTGLKSQLPSQGFLWEGWQEGVLP